MKDFLKIIDVGEQPDYEQCIFVSMKASLSEMLAPRVSVIICLFDSGFVWKLDLCGFYVSKSSRVTWTYPHHKSMVFGYSCSSVAVRSQMLHGGVELPSRLATDTCGCLSQKLLKKIYGPVWRPASTGGTTMSKSS